MIRRRTHIFSDIDWLTVILYFLLVFMGWVNIYAAVFNPENSVIFDISQRYGKQLIWIGFAVLIIAVIFIIDVKFYRFFAYPIYILLLVLLLLVLGFGTEVNGAKSWFQIGSFRIQPAEFGKFATNLVLASFLSRKNIRIHQLKTLIRLSIIIFLPAVFILLQNDTGSAIVYTAFFLTLYREGLSGTFLFLGLLAVVLFIMGLMLPLFALAIGLIITALILFYFDGRNLKQTLIVLLIYSVSTGIFYGIKLIFNLDWSLFLIHFLGLILSSILFLYFTYLYKLRFALLLLTVLIGSIFYISSVDYVFNQVLEQHQQDRIKILLGVKTDVQGAGYNVNQSKIAIGSGGLTGKGFLQGTQTKFDFVPEQSTDFIFCTIGEEWGFVGTFTVISLFILLLLRLIYLAERQRSHFNRIYGYGVVAILFFHFAVNIGMTIGLAPVIGIPLPFFSYGGSSLWAFTLLLFVFIKLDSTRKAFLQ